MVDRTLVALAAGLIAVLVALVGAWVILSAYTLIGWQIPVAAGIAVTIAMWFVDWMTDYLARHRNP